jgi:F-type H+-transporting ATPase subunit b
MNLLVLAAEQAHGAADSATGQHLDVMYFGIVPYITSLVVFLLTLVILGIFVWPKIVKGLNDRDQKIRDEIAGAEQAREQAKQALAEYEKSLATARDEASSMIAKARQDAKAAAEETRARIEAEATDLKDRATREIQTAKAAAIAELHGHAATLAAAMAAKILRREISVSDQQRLVEESLKELTSAGRN